MTRRTGSLLFSAVILSSALIQLGCAGAPSGKAPTEAQGVSIVLPPLVPAHVALVSAGYEPKVESPPIGAYTGSTLKNAGMGAGGGAMVGAQIGCGVGLAGGPFALILCPVFGVAGAAVGAVGGVLIGAEHGVAEGRPNPETREAKGSVEPVMTTLKVQQSLVDSVQSSLKQATGATLAAFSSMGPAALDKRVDYTQIGSQGFATVLETSVTRFGFDSAGGKNPDIALFMVVHARLVDTASGKETWSRDFAYLSEYAYLPAWASQEGALTTTEYVRAHHALGERIVEEVFLRIVMEGRIDSKPPEPAKADAVCGIRPKDPRLDVRNWPTESGSAFIASNTVDSLQPTLRWEAFAFPGADDNPVEAKVPRYDLRIWRGKGYNDAPRELLYERNDIPQAFHTLDQPLDPGGEYFWSVRARLPTAEATYVTHWSQSRLPPFSRRTKFLESIYAGQPGLRKQMEAAGFDVHSKRWSPCVLDFIPDANYYRFSTKPAPLTNDESGRRGATVLPIAAEKTAPLPPVSRSEPVSAVTAATATPAPTTESDQFLKVGDRWKYKFSDRGRDVGSVTVEIVESSGPVKVTPRG